MTDKLRKTLTDVVRILSDDAWLPGKLGFKGEDGSVRFSTNRPGYVIVRRGGEGQLGMIHARYIGERHYIYDLPVEVRLKHGEWIARVDEIRAAPFLGGSGIGTTTHRRGSGSEFVWEAELFAPGLVQHSSGMVVRILPFFYFHEGAQVYFPGGTIDLTSFKPVTAGQWCWVLVGVDPSDNEPVAVAGTAQSTASPLNIADLVDIDFSAYFPCAGVKVKNSDTSLGAWNRYWDAHEWFNRGGGGGGVSTLGGLSDVTLTTPADRALLAFDNASGDWIDGPVTTAYTETLLDDANAAAARTTLGLGTIATEAETAYFLANGSRLLTGDFNLDTGANAGSLSFRTPEVVNNLAVIRFATSGTLGVTSAAVIADLIGVITQADPSALKGKLWLRTNRGDSVQLAMVLGDDGNVGIGVDPATGKLHVDQASTTAAIPTLILDQADLSEEFIRFVATVGAGNPINTSALGSYYGRVRVHVEGVGAKWLALYD